MKANVKVRGGYLCPRCGPVAGQRTVGIAHHTAWHCPTCGGDVRRPPLDPDARHLLLLFAAGGLAAYALQTGWLAWPLWVAGSWLLWWRR